jgi:hypothetical protein
MLLVEKRTIHLQKGKRGYVRHEKNPKNKLGYLAPHVFRLPSQSKKTILILNYNLELKGLLGLWMTDLMEKKRMSVYFVILK